MTKPELVIQVKCGVITVLFALIASDCAQAESPGQVGPDWIVSANDAKYVRSAGRDTYPANTGPDTLTLLDASDSPPAVRATIEIEHTIAGPPQAVAIVPGGKLAVVSAPNRYDRTTHQVVLGTFLQIIDLEASRPRVNYRIELGSHPQGLAINPSGTLVLAATLSGTVAVLAIEGKTVRLIDSLKLCDGRLSGVTFTHDGRAALVCRRDDQGVAVLSVEEGRVRASGELINSGVAPYSIEVSSEGSWAVVSNVGLGGLNSGGVLCGDADSFTLLNVAARPFRAVEYVTVPSTPEGIAISPNGRWIAVQSMAGSNLPRTNPGRQERGRILLFALKDGHATLTASLPGGEASQGIVFTADSRRILVQFNVEKEIALFEVNGGKLFDTGRRIAVSGGPASIRSQPR